MSTIIAISVLGFLIYDMRRAKEVLDRALASVALLLLLPISIVGFALLYQEIGLVEGDDVPVTTFADSLYFSIITWTTVGYGDIKPSPRARLWAAAESFYGYVLMAFLIAQIISWLDAARSREGARSSK
jgi:hypothetical protein